MKNKFKVLLADDHDLFRQGLASLLQNHDLVADINQVKTGSEALEFIVKQEPDIAILDVTMPILSGLEVCQQLQDENVKTRCMILTMHDDPLLAMEALQYGASGYMLKDNTFEEMKQAIECIMNNDTFLSPSIAVHLKNNPNKTIPLSMREREVLQRMASGASVKIIAADMNVSSKTIDTYRQRLLKKLCVENTAQLIQYAAKRSLI